MGGAGALRAEALREALPDFYARGGRRHRARPDRPARDRHHRRRGRSAPSRSTPWCRCARSWPSPATTACMVTLPGLDVTDEEVQTPARPLRENDARARRGGPARHRRRPGDDRPPRHTSQSGAEVVGVDDYLYEVGSGVDGPRARRRAARRQGRRHPGLRRRTRARGGERRRSGCWSRRSRTRSCPRRPTSGRPRAPSSTPWPSSGPTSPTGIGQRQAHAEPDGAAPEDHRGPGRAGHRRRCPEVLVDAEVNERLHDLQHRLEAQKLGLAEYFQATGTSPDELLAELRVGRPGSASRPIWRSGPWSRPRS